MRLGKVQLAPCAISVWGLLCVISCVCHMIILVYTQCKEQRKGEDWAELEILQEKSGGEITKIPR